MRLVPKSGKQDNRQQTRQGYGACCYSQRRNQGQRPESLSEQASALAEAGYPSGRASSHIEPLDALRRSAAVVLGGVARVDDLRHSHARYERSGHCVIVQPTVGRPG